MLHATERISGGAMWANLHLLFWLSLVPFVTAWMGEHPEAAIPSAAYGIVLLMCGIAYTILQKLLLTVPGGNPRLAAAVGRDVKGKLSVLLYLTAIGLAFVNQWIADDPTNHTLPAPPELKKTLPGCACEYAMNSRTVFTPSPGLTVSALVL